MELTQLRYFLAVAQTQHMTETAKQLHIAQPALSQAIHRLEESLGVPLFMPKGRNIVLTPYGRYLQEQLRPLLQQLDQLPSTLQTMAKLHGQTIHLSVLAASTLVTSAIIDYKNDHSDLDFQLLQNTGDELFDIEITTEPAHQVRRGQDQYVCTEAIYLAVPNNRTYRGRTSIALKEVEREGFISLIGSRQFRFLCDRFCRQAGVQPHIIFESDNVASVRNMIAANLGIGFWPAFTWGQMESDKVLLLEVSDVRCSRDIVITCHHNKQDNSQVQSFFDFLAEYFEQRRTGKIKA